MGAVFSGAEFTARPEIGSSAARTIGTRKRIQRCIRMEHIRHHFEIATQIRRHFMVATGAKTDLSSATSDESDSSNWLQPLPDGGRPLGRGGRLILRVVPGLGQCHRPSCLGTRAACPARFHQQRRRRSSRARIRNGRHAITCGEDEKQYYCPCGRTGPAATDTNHFNYSEPRIPQYWKVLPAAPARSPDRLAPTYTASFSALRGLTRITLRAGFA